MTYRSGPRPGLPDALVEPGKVMPAWIWAGWALLVFSLPYRMFYVYTLNGFYHQGAHFADTGLFTHLLWHNDWTLWNPPARGNFSFFGVHFSPIFLLLTLLSYGFPGQPPEFFACWSSALYASLGLALFLSFRCFLFPKSHWHMALLALAGVMFSFNPLVMNGLWLPHFEYAIPLGIFLFLLLYRLRRHVAAWFALACTLMVREDAGFHLAAVLGLLMLLRYRERHSWRAVHRELFLCVACAAYSGLALWVVDVNDPGRVSVLDLIYLGDGSYRHLTWELLGSRLVHIGTEHAALLLAIAVTLLCAWRFRDAYLPVAALAYMPWFVFNLTAVNANTGILYAYYAFPFVLVFCWPLVAALWRYGVSVPAGALRRALIVQVMLLSVGLLHVRNGVEIAPFARLEGGSYHVRQATRDRDAVHDFAARFQAGEGHFGKVYLDHRVMTLLGSRYGGEFVNAPQWRGLGSDTVMYMKPGNAGPDDYLAQVIRTNGLTHHYCLARSTICLYSNRAADALQAASFGLTEMRD